MDRVEELEEEVAALRLQVDRSRPGGETSPDTRPVLPEPPVASDPDAPDLAGFVETLMGRKRARDADAFWQDVRDAVEASMRRKGPMAIDGLFRALPDRLKARGAEVGLPLTPAWLRYHLLRLSEAVEGVAEIEGRFSLAPVAPAVDEAAGIQESAEADLLGKRPFWRMFVLSVHQILVEHGPLPVEDILARMPSQLVLETRRFQKIMPGRLRYKLRVRIDEHRPFEELADGRFAALTGEVPWDGEVPLLQMARTG
ncbi:hypothetical protein [Methylobacterium sp. J-068]|uniref:hypothetical protein n=1 Tax=Methylobacterium sp. J-068 TaxID=2836649 RepID=UPI001FBA36CF|nr:hypothetical protein [Methylobacterium sp. J-068]MCJ2035584.1 hypothetical protein [Methylobacterium sp. J-068]